VALDLDAYIRVSRVGGRAGEGYISPDVQREAIEGYARDLGGAIVAWHDDQDYSGGNVERPGFQQVLERLRDGETDGIIVMKIDRFARSVADGAAVVRGIISRKQVFASCHERIDSRTPEGKYMLTSFLANAELFLDQAKASWWTAKARAVARGAHIGPTPIGYQRIPKGEERSGCLLPHPVYGPRSRICSIAPRRACTETRRLPAG
jgi:site-specific DNA recombinase